jgi:hypothetical protein
MDYPVTRDELTLISRVGRTSTYMLQTEGKLSAPHPWCGRAMFCLKQALAEIAQANGLQPPTQEALLTHWSLIIQARSKKIP